MANIGTTYKITEARNGGFFVSEIGHRGNLVQVYMFALYEDAKRFVDYWK